VHALPASDSVTRPEPRCDAQRERGQSRHRQLGERYRVAVRIRDLRVADTVRVSLDRFMLDTFGSQAFQEDVESGNDEGYPARARALRMRLNEERGVLVNS
jgi:hypothetical protein